MKDEQSKPKKIKTPGPSIPNYPICGPTHGAAQNNPEMKAKLDGCFPRQTGKTEAMIQKLAIRLRDNELVGIAGCKDPARILKRLSDLGVDAESKVMSYWREESRERIYSGYLFQVKFPDPDPIIPDFDRSIVYFIGDEIRYEDNVWVLKPINSHQSWIMGLYPGTGNGWKIKKP